MKIGAMNDPQRDLFDEIRQIAAGGFDYVDSDFGGAKG